MILVSACLAGIRCRYDGSDKLIQEIQNLVKEGKAVLVCPEQLGGLSTPREPAEIQGGDGSAVLKGQASVISKDGKDVTAGFIKGAEETLKIAQLYDIEYAVLKARSPSCGKDVIYNGSFSKEKRAGDGVAAALLIDHGIKIIDEDEFLETTKDQPF
ncbi:MAG: DUF523 domain-containing protein [Bacillota bacterium]